MSSNGWMSRPRAGRTSRACGLGWHGWSSTAHRIYTGPDLGWRHRPADIAQAPHGEAVQAITTASAPLSRRHRPAVPHDLDDRAVVARVQVPGRRALPREQVELHAPVPLEHGRLKPGSDLPPHQRCHDLAPDDYEAWPDHALIVRREGAGRPGPGGPKSPSATTSGRNRCSASTMSGGSRRLWTCSTRRTRPWETRRIASDDLRQGDTAEMLSDARPDAGRQRAARGQRGRR